MYANESCLQNNCVLNKNIRNTSVNTFRNNNLLIVIQAIILFQSVFSHRSISILRIQVGGSIYKNMITTGNSCYFRRHFLQKRNISLTMGHLWVMSLDGHAPHTVIGWMDNETIFIFEWVTAVVTECLARKKI